MGFFGNAAKKGTTKAGKAAAKKIRGGCPGSDDGKHSYKSRMMHEVSKGKKKATGYRVTYCHNPGCGRVLN